MCFLQSLHRAPDVIIVTETWLSVFSKDICNIENYASYYNIRNDRRGGGVSIFYKKCLNVVHLESFFVSNDSIESLSIRIKLKQVEFYIIGVYRPHSGTIELFTHALNSLINDNIQSMNNVISLWGF